jgi:hypothetical protein
METLSPLQREMLILTLPPDPGYARLAHLAALHFLRAQGMRIVRARRSARTIESRSRTALRAAARKDPRAVALALTYTTGPVELQAELSGVAAGKSRLLVLRRRSRQP